MRYLIETEFPKINEYFARGYTSYAIAKHNERSVQYYTRKLRKLSSLTYLDMQDVTRAINEMANADETVSTLFKI